MSSKSEKICLLASSGLNTLCLLKRFSVAGAKVHPVFIQAGFRWEEAELFWLKKYLRNTKMAGVQPLEILQLPLRDVFGMHWSVTGVKVPPFAEKADVFLPGRTLAMLLKAGVMASVHGFESVAIGTTKDARLPDASEAFFRECERALALAIGMAVRVQAPFLVKSREDVLFEAKDLAPDLSFSCVNPKSYQHCGECFKCNERKRAFARTGITDKTQYFSKAAVSG